ncbi:MAG: choice-of-anchor D domain-containing protein [Sedimenticola sp.]
MRRSYTLLTALLCWMPALPLWAATDIDISINPVYRTFPEASLQSESAAQLIVVTNHGGSALAINTAQLEGLHADQFAIVTNGCTTTTLAASGGSCSVEAKFTPTSRGTKMARLDVVFSDARTLSAFLSNSEEVTVESERRLPPILLALDIPEKMENGQTHTLTWSLLGYHDDYQTQIVFFNCIDINDSSCGNSYSDPGRFDESGVLTPVTSRAGEWAYNGTTSTEFDYSYAFTPTGFTVDTNIVVRFYRRNMTDAAAVKSSLSLIIPGNLSTTYYDTEGRRLQKTVCITPGCATP